MKDEAYEKLDETHQRLDDLDERVERVARSAVVITANFDCLFDRPTSKPDALHAGPPKLAGFFLALLLNESAAEHALGDLAEHFRKDTDRFGVSRAHWLYWARVLKSLWPSLRHLAGRAIRLGAFVEAVRRFF